MSVPDVSVVMGVYNGAVHLEPTLESILSQEGCSLEFIVVDDGSTDDTGRILDQWAQRDERLRVIHQQNTGLTGALIRGCAQALGELIARQDAGDVSLPGRLAAQVAQIQAVADAVLVACGARFVGPADELLYELVRPGQTLGAGLALLDVHAIAGPPHHGATMFRRDVYLEVGGYRAAFTVAQDIDLWLRLTERGRVWGQEDVLYVARLAPNSISSRRRDEQMRAGLLAIECAKVRRNGENDESLLYMELSPDSHRGGAASRQERSRFFYFLGSCLRNTDPVASRRYFARAVRENPLFLKALARRILG